MARQVHEAEWQSSELVRSVQSDDPQAVTRDGQEIDIKEYLRSGPGFEQLDLSRSADHPRTVGWVTGA